MTTVKVFAPAKINLTLHITGQRADGYHLLDSLVCFADIGDHVSATPADAHSLTLEGPEAKGLKGEGDNLVLRAAQLIAPDRGAALRLTKNLPVASGIGGGSADAAAALKALGQLFELNLPEASATLALGADVPACLTAQSLRMRGVGEIITPLPALPAAEIILINPRVAVSTPAVFAALEQKDNAPMSEKLPVWETLDEMAAWLDHQRNDLRPPAIAQQPVIEEVLSALRSTQACFVGMSGSGATCFALYPKGAVEAASVLRNARPEWWVQAGALLSVS